jgi:hypothetical protein
MHEPAALDDQRAVAESIMKLTTCSVTMMAILRALRISFSAGRCP